MLPVRIISHEKMGIVTDQMVTKISYGEQVEQPETRAPAIMIERQQQKEIQINPSFPVWRRFPCDGLGFRCS